ncbi:hypothetical protein CCYN2B_110150 [Capnocytophaga cynodegmi]|uniref:Uncharacterized protein n=1 Tax=Capnocytophaga cynodegmi TaxID=28189 RepID=A0A0B7GZ94_9FLAO|nr:hypothetical protein CCYN2B_110150 [Capnocytophaga cynodegmi]
MCGITSRLGVHISVEYLDIITLLWFKKEKILVNPICSTFLYRNFVFYGIIII